MFAYCTCGYGTDDFDSIDEITEQVIEDGGIGLTCPICGKNLRVD